MVRLKRAYESPSPDDGYRVLVDRLWPRGLRKEQVCVDQWLKEIAPSDALRKWFRHDPDSWTAFEERYAGELDSEDARTVLDALSQKAASQTVTLVFAARDEEHNNAVVLKELIEQRLRRRPGRAKPARATRSARQVRSAKPGRKRRAARPNRSASPARKTTGSTKARTPTGASGSGRTTRRPRAVTSRS